jgi:hypothetical protein
MHPSRIEPKTSWKHTKALTTKPLQHIINKEGKSLSLSCLAWNYLKNSKFNIHFLLQNLFKCYKLKDDLEIYSKNYYNLKKIKL